MSLKTMNVIAIAIPVSHDAIKNADAKVERMASNRGGSLFALNQSPVIPSNRRNIKNHVYLIPNPLDLKIPSTYLNWIIHRFARHLDSRVRPEFFSDVALK